ncbi:hypothetical protein V6Z12_A03G084900 [Gossypium hirsutum]
MTKLESPFARAQERNKRPSTLAQQPSPHQTRVSETETLVSHLPLLSVSRTSHRHLSSTCSHHLLEHLQT